MLLNVLTALDSARRRQIARAVWVALAVCAALTADCLAQLQQTLPSQELPTPPEQNLPSEELPPTPQEQNPHTLDLPPPRRSRTPSPGSQLPPPRRASQKPGKPSTPISAAPPDEPISVEIVDTPEQRVAAEKREAEAKLKAIDDHNLVEYSRNQVQIGALTFLIFILQLVAFVYQARYMRSSVDAIRQTTIAAIKSSQAAEKIANSAELKADAFSKTDRPIVMISDIRPSIRDGFGEKFTGTMIPRTIFLKMAIKNYGGLPAIVAKISAQLRFSKENASLGFESITKMPLLLPIGGEYEADIPIGGPLNENIAAALNDMQNEIWLHFSIGYRGILDRKQTHETAGRWRYNLMQDYWSGENDIET